MKKSKLQSLVLVLLCQLIYSSLSSQVYTKVDAAGRTGIKIVDPEGVKLWKAFDHKKTNAVVEEDDPVPGNCANPYIKDPTAKLTSNKSYWILYRDCAENPQAGNKTEVECKFYGDPSHVNTWVQMEEKSIPSSSNNLMNYVLPVLLIIVVFFLVRRQ